MVLVAMLCEAFDRLDLELLPEPWYRNVIELDRHFQSKLSIDLLVSKSLVFIVVGRHATL